jgi:hypothetical protein
MSEMKYIIALVHYSYYFLSTQPDVCPTVSGQWVFSLRLHGHGGAGKTAPKIGITRMDVCIFAITLV